MSATDRLGRAGAGLQAAAVFAGLAVVYRLTLLPGVGFSGDTAKFQFIGRVLGTPHNTGYPAYVLLNAAFVRLVPVGSLAERANLLSAVLAAAACAVLVLTLRRLGVRPVVAVVLPVVLGLSYTFWSQAVAAEVYALHLFCMAAVLYLLVRWQQGEGDGPLVGAAAVAALSIGNHLLTLLLLPGIAWFVLATDRSVLRRLRTVALVGALGAAGIAQYGFVVWRTNNPAPDTYVQSEARDVGDLVGVLRGEEFESEMFRFSPAEVVDERVPLLWEFVRRDLSVVLVAAAVGVVAARRRRPLLGLCLLWIGADVLFALEYGVVDITVFLLPAELGIAVLAALGVDAVLDRVRTVRPAVTLAVCALPLVFAGWSWDVVARSKNVRDAATARDAVADAPDGAVLVSGEYETSMFMLYDLLGEDVQEERDVRLADRADPDRIAVYVRGVKSLDVSGGPVAPGRVVVAVGEEVRDAALKRGLRAVPAGDERWRLVPA